MTGAPAEALSDSRAVVSDNDQHSEPYPVDVVAKRLRVSAGWLQKEAAAGRVPHRKLGRRRLFMEADVQQILAAAAAGQASRLTAGSARAKRRTT